MPVDTSLFHFSVTPSVAEVGQTVTFDATIGPKLSHFLHTPTWSRSPSSIEMVHIGMGKYFGTKVVTLADGGTWNCTVYPYNESVYMAEVPLYVSKGEYYVFVCDCACVCVCICMCVCVCVCVCLCV